MRKYYIDNLRNLIIFLLFPVHTFMIWNDFGSKFYIWDTENRLLSTLIVSVNPWFMPILFTFAGISARHAMKRRTTKEHIQERINKLLLPFICGIILLVPIQTLYARKFFFHYNGGFFNNLKYFFTHITDMSGYDGAFTPGHLWFILFLFVISMFSLLFIHFLPYEKVENKISKINIGTLVALFIPICIMYYIGNFGGFSFGRSFALYLIGFYVLSNDNVVLILEKNIIWLTITFLVAEIGLVITYYQMNYYGDLLVHFVMWMGILVLMIAGKRFLNNNTAFTKYFNGASFPIYIFHQSVLIVLAYYVLKFVDSLFLRIIVIIPGSFLLSLLCYEIIRRFPYIRKMFGIKQ